MEGGNIFEVYFSIRNYTFCKFYRRNPKCSDTITDTSQYIRTCNYVSFIDYKNNQIRAGKRNREFSGGNYADYVYSAGNRIAGNMG